MWNYDQDKGRVYELYGSSSMRQQSTNNIYSGQPGASFLYHIGSLSQQLQFRSHFLPTSYKYK